MEGTDEVELLWWLVAVFFGVVDLVAVTLPITLCSPYQS
jgi:hypothetical protein